MLGGGWAASRRLTLFSATCGRGGGSAAIGRGGSVGDRRGGSVVGGGGGVAV